MGSDVVGLHVGRVFLDAAIRHRVGHLITIQVHPVGGTVGTLLDPHQGLIGAAVVSDGAALLGHHLSVQHEGVIGHGHAAEPITGVAGEQVALPVGEVDVLLVALEVEDPEVSIGHHHKVTLQGIAVDRVEVGVGCEVGREALDVASPWPLAQALHHRGVAIDLFLSLGGEAQRKGLLADPVHEVRDRGGNDAHV